MQFPFSERVRIGFSPFFAKVTDSVLPSNGNWKTWVNCAFRTMQTKKNDRMDIFFMATAVWKVVADTLVNL